MENNHSTSKVKNYALKLQQLVASPMQRQLFEPSMIKQTITKNWLNNMDSVNNYKTLQRKYQKRFYFSDFYSANWQRYLFLNLGEWAAASIKPITQELGFLKVNSSSFLKGFILNSFTTSTAMAFAAQTSYKKYNNYSG